MQRTSRDAAKNKERSVFEAFLIAHPTLAAQIYNWRVQEQEGAFPDVIATLHNNGSKIGFELGEWLHEEQTKQCKKEDQFASSILDAIGRPQPENQTQHIDGLLLTPKNDQICGGDQTQKKIREELFKLIEEKDRQWSNEQHWQSPQGYYCREFDGFPTLGKYLAQVWFVPLSAGGTKKKLRPPEIPWIDIEGRGGSYSAEFAREALRKIIRKKLKKYGGSFGHPVNLLIHYGTDGFIYNTPFIDSTTSSFERAANLASTGGKDSDTERRLPFEKVYLCNTIQSELEAYEIFPQFLRCT